MVFICFFSFQLAKPVAEEPSGRVSAIHKPAHLRSQVRSAFIPNHIQLKVEVPECMRAGYTENLSPTCVKTYLR